MFFQPTPIHNRPIQLLSPRPSVSSTLTQPVDVLISCYSTSCKLLKSPLLPAILLSSFQQLHPLLIFLLPPWLTFQVPFFRFLFLRLNFECQNSPGPSQILPLLSLCSLWVLHNLSLTLNVTWIQRSSIFVSLQLSPEFRVQVQPPSWHSWILF